MQLKSKKGVLSRIDKEDIYELFLEFMAMPSLVKRMDVGQLEALGVSMDDYSKELRGIKNQQEFEERFKLYQAETTRWKQRDDYEKRKKDKVRLWCRDRTPNVITGIYKAAVSGNPASQKLWLQYVEEWIETQGMRMEGSLRVKEARDVIKGLIGNKANKVNKANKNAKK